ncbi:MAG: hypothetical protein WDW38_008202 [Sanguina aurantia]
MMGLATDVITDNPSSDSDASALALEVAALRASDAQRLVNGRRLPDIVADVFSLSDSPGDAEITSIAFLTKNSTSTVASGFIRLRNSLHGALKSAQQKLLQQKQQRTVDQITASNPSLPGPPQTKHGVQKPATPSAAAEDSTNITQSHVEAWQRQQDRLGNCLDSDGSIGQAPHMSGMFIKAIQSTSSLKVRCEALSALRATSRQAVLARVVGAALLAVLTAWMTAAREDEQASVACVRRAPQALGARTRNLIGCRSCASDPVLSAPAHTAPVTLVTGSQPTWACCETDGGGAELQSPGCASSHPAPKPAQRRRDAMLLEPPHSPRQVTVLRQLLDTLTHIDRGTSLLVSPALQAEVLAVAADPELGEAVSAAAQALADKWAAQKLQPGGKTGQSSVLAAHQGSAAAAFAAGGRSGAGHVPATCITVAAHPAAADDDDDDMCAAEIAQLRIDRENRQQRGVAQTAQSVALSYPGPHGEEMAAAVATYLAQRAALAEARAAAERRDADRAHAWSRGASGMQPSMEWPRQGPRVFMPEPEGGVTLPPLHHSSLAPLHPTQLSQGGRAARSVLPGLPRDSHSRQQQHPPGPQEAPHTPSLLPQSHPCTDPHPPSSPSFTPTPTTICWHSDIAWEAHDQHTTAWAKGLRLPQFVTRRTGQANGQATAIPASATQQQQQQLQQQQQQLPGPPAPQGVAAPVQQGPPTAR